MGTEPQGASFCTKAQGMMRLLCTAGPSTGQLAAAAVGGGTSQAQACTAAHGIAPGAHNGEGHGGSSAHPQVQSKLNELIFQLP